jgi:hypothetical protein
MATKKKAPAKKAAPAPKKAPTVKRSHHAKKAPAYVPPILEKPSTLKEFDDPTFVSELSTPTFVELPLKRYSARLGVRLHENPNGEWVKFSDL